MAHDQSELLQGTLELLVLKTLSLEPMHGWGISQRIQQMSRDVFQVNQGCLYPALQRLKTRGWIDAEWRTTENNRRARYYRLTPAGSGSWPASARSGSAPPRRSTGCSDWAGGAA